jgi:hypothetical protein
MNKLLLLITLNLFFGACATKDYSKLICKKSTAQYKFLLNGLAFNPYNTVIAKTAITSIHRDKKQKIIHINYQYTPRIIPILHLLDSVNTSIQADTVSLLVLNGLPINPNNYATIQIEMQSVESIKIFKPEKSIYCKPMSYVLVINSKN